MPEKIYVTYNYLPEDRARAQQMFLEAGMLDVVVDPALLSGFQKLFIPNEETIAAMRAARKGKTETVTLDQLQSVLDADN